VFRLKRKPSSGQVHWKVIRKLLGTHNIKSSKRSVIHIPLQYSDLLRLMYTACKKTHKIIYTEAHMLLQQHHDTPWKTYQQENLERTIAKIAFKDFFCGRQAGTKCVAKNNLLFTNSLLLLLLYVG